MTAFWLLSSLLLVLALAFVLVPLLRWSRRSDAPAREAINLAVYRDQLEELEADLKNGVVSAEQADKSRQELQRRMLEDVAPDNSAAPATPKTGRSARVGVVITAGLAIPVAAALLYFQIGNPTAITAVPSHQASRFSDKQMAELVERLAKRMQERPDDLEGWVLLARSYASMGRFDAASEAMARVTRIKEDDAGLWADYADVLAMAQGQNLKGRPAELIQRALQLDPTNHKALALAGTAAFDAGDFPGAVAYWERLRAQLPPGSEIAGSVQAGIEEARARAQGSVPAAAAPPAPPAAASGARVAGTVTLSPELAAKVAPDDVLFVFARAAAGPKMPLAIVRLTARDLPAKFSLDDSMAMAPGMNLANFPEVVVGARISKSGSAMPQSGDLEGLTPAVKVGSTNLSVTINSVRP